VNRPATEADLDAFEEKTFEVTETREEVVMDKTARVIEEVIISKDVDVHTETVRDTVRQTKVDVDQIAEFDTYDDTFRNHYNTTYADSGYRYEQFEPAYRYGHSLAADERFYGRDWAEIEPEARRHWEETNQGTWEDFKDAVRRGWYEITGQM
jgi:hypothetical protein